MSAHKQKERLLSRVLIMCPMRHNLRSMLPRTAILICRFLQGHPSMCEPAPVALMAARYSASSSGFRLSNRANLPAAEAA